MRADASCVEVVQEPSEVPCETHSGLVRENHDRFAADVGTLVHRYLQLIAEDGLTYWPVHRVADLKRQMALWFEKQGYTSQESSFLAHEVASQLKVTLESEDGRWILGPHEEAVCEKSYTTLAEGVMQTHVIDRMFKVDGVRWRVDYKTTSVVASDVTQLNEDHVGQLSRYRGLFPQGEDIRLAIFYTKMGIKICV